MRTASIMDKAGYKKLRNSCKAAKDLGIGWVWIDTCCIDKKSSAELQGATNSMWRIYNRSVICLAYINDLVVTSEDAECSLVAEQGLSEHVDWASFEQSQWFKRGWTLQELLTPKYLTFFSPDWRPFGSRPVLLTKSIILQPYHKNVS